MALEIQWLDGSLEDVFLQERVQLLKAEYLIQTGDRDQALEILRLVEARRDHAPASERAANRLKELQGNNDRSFRFEDDLPVWINKHILYK